MEPMEAKTPDFGSRLATLRELQQQTIRLGFPPSLSELAGALGISAPGVKKHIDHMVKIGLVTRGTKVPRSLVVTSAGRLVLKNRRG